MDLLEILNKILVTKNEIRDILGENNNIARYSVSIHNILAKSYNESYREGFHERWYTLTGNNRWLSGPQQYLEYDVNPRYYDKFTTEVLTDIMRDVLNYRLIMKDEMNIYIEPDIDNNFQEYPDYLRDIINRVSDIGYQDGIDDADDSYEGTSDVEIPTISYSDNMFSLSSSQSEALIYFSLGEYGVPTIYTDDVIISEDCTIYYWAKIGKKISEKQTYSASISSSGNYAFVFPPNIYQDNNKIYLSTSTKGASIQYSIDDGQWDTYYGPILVTSSMSSIKAMCTRNNEYSKYNTSQITHDVSIDQYRPKNVMCSFTPISGGTTVTLSCDTDNARIFYAIDDADGFYREYTQPVDELNNHFILYTYSVKDGYQSKMKLVYKYDVGQSSDIPADVQVIEEGNIVTLYTTTSGAKIMYRLGSVGSFTSVDANAVTLTLNDLTYLYAYSTKNNVNSRNITEYVYYPNGNINNGKPAAPSIIQNGNDINISSPFEVRYTLNQSDPRAYGIVYNAAIGITITEYTVVKAVAINNGVYSDVVTKQCVYNQNAGGGSGSEPGTGGNPTSGTDTTDPFVSGNWFSITGISAISFNGELYFAADGYQYWKTVNGGSAISGLDSQTKYYFKGNVENIAGFTGAAVISGDISSIKGGTTGRSDLNYSGLFRGCANLVNASDIVINITNMVPNMLQDMFNGCTSLTEAAFSISTNIISANGLQRMFYGCTSLVGGPIYEINNIGDYGMASAFQDCVRLSSTGFLNLESCGVNGLSSCFKNCRELDVFSMTTPSGVSSSNVFSNMFEGCTGLRDVSGIVNRFDTIAPSSFFKMFYGCSSLRSVFPLLSTTVGTSGYQSMFEGCSSLVSPPVLGGTDLSQNCYNSMFRGCTSLRNAPDLDVENLSGIYSCYANMFENCSNLQYIKAMFINRPTGLFSANWVKGVAASGTFVVNREADWPASEVAFGVNSIPEGWTVVGAAVTGKILDIWAQDGYCFISSNNDDQIWYNTSTSSPIVDPQYLTNQYTEKFKLFNECYVSAACKNSDGVFGSVYYEFINPNYPNLIVFQRSGKIWINTGTEFTYDNIQYQICEFGTDTVIQDMTMYNSQNGFTIDQDRRIKAYGYINNVVVTTTTVDLYYDTTSPVIEFFIGWNGDHTQILRLYFNLSYPNPENLADGDNSFYYKINDNNEDDPDTAPEAWTQGKTGELTGYIDSTHEMVTVTAIAKILHSGAEIWSSKNKQEMHRGETESLADPIFIQLSQSNNAVIEYKGQQYPTWSDPDVRIEYKYNTGGAIQNYTKTINIADSWAYAAQYVDIYSRARIGSIYTEWYKNTLYYDPQYLHFEINDPEVSAVLENGKIMIYMTNVTPNAEYYNVVNYIKIEVIEYDRTGLYPTGSVYGTYVPFSYPFELNGHVVKFRLWGQSCLHNDWSNEVQSKIYDIKTDFGIMWDDRPAPTVTINPSTHYITITCPFTVTPTLYMTNVEWGTGAINEHKYDYERLVTYYNFGETGNGVYSGYLDEHLASGTMYIAYDYEGIKSEYYSFEYTNSSVQPLIAPTVSVEWDKKKKYYILYLTNSVNDGVSLQYRMENCVWNGGVVNTHKYDDPKVCSLYGDTISEYLIESYIIGITVYDPHDTNQTRESLPYHFENYHITPLGEPSIFLVEKTNNDAVKITNKNNLATNYWRCLYSNSVWSPSAVNPHKYDDWMIGFTTDNDLDTDLLSGVIEAKSVWGDETSEIVEYNYDSGRTIDDTPPTITVTLDSTETFYNVTITNNADLVNFPRIKWKVNEIEWNGEEFCSADNYQKTIGDGYMIQTGTGNTVTFTIGKDIISGVIEAYATNEANNIQVGNRTPMTIVEFSNGLI